MEKLKIMVADSHEVVRLGIGFIFKCTADIEVIAEAASCSEVARKADECRPDVVIMDARLADQCSINTCRVLKEKHPNLKVIMLVSPSDENSIFNAITAGADSLLPKQIKSQELTGAVRMVVEGKAMLDRPLLPGL